MTHLLEINLDSIVGPTHHFGGLGVGNLASRGHAGQPSSPRAAALQGIEKMRMVMEMGGYQVVLPPQRRPDMRVLRRCGFKGSIESMLARLADQEVEGDRWPNPILDDGDSQKLLAAAWSASAMWTANAATVTAPEDSADGLTHLTVANLISSLHRSLEPPRSFRLLRWLLQDRSFVVHPPLPASMPLRDEGAANHMRLSHRGGPGINVFVFGSDDDEQEQAPSARFPSRQTRAAQTAIARLHLLRPRDTFYLRQHPAAISAGAFHNDVVATNCHGVLLHHELAFADSQSLEAIEDRYGELNGRPMIRYEIKQSQLSLDAAISTYLFNCQLIAMDDVGEEITMLCPIQVAEDDAAREAAERLTRSGGPIRRLEYVDLRESMSNGGGPACVRLRVPMSQHQFDTLPGNVRLTPRLADQLSSIVARTYRDRLTVADLGDPKFAIEANEAVDQIGRLLGWQPTK